MLTPWGILETKINLSRWKCLDWENTREIITRGPRWETTVPSLSSIYPLLSIHGIYSLGSWSETRKRKCTLLLHFALPLPIKTSPRALRDRQIERKPILEIPQRCRNSKLAIAHVLTVGEKFSLIFPGNILPTNESDSIMNFNHPR